MQIQHRISLKPYNTFGIDAIARNFVLINHISELIDVVKNYPKEDLFFLSGGSNILITQPEIDKLVVKLNLKGIEVIDENEDFVWVKSASGEVLHDFILWCLDNDFGGLENLSLIPGHVGTAPMQNVGAYGVETKDVMTYCTALNLGTLELEQFNNETCRFGYRESFFKHEGKGKFVITEVVFKLSKRNHTLHTDYGDIRKELERMQINNPTIQDVSRAVIAIRSAKLPDPKELGNSGSFFKNPVVDQLTFEKFINRHPEAPHYIVSENEIKIPAGWLIEQSGLKGYREGDAGVHQRQALVLVNYGNATGQDIWRLAEKVQQTVSDKFGITIYPEVNIV
ncbi:UDP-N-acetylmuramate dehydrogenase [Avrilella dinanensis]|uniref:UDP-N-acetylmuramate dehydrogenase n=1 Tax=Avrilella dinanensis TaxID=2008672 RepID=UPI0024094B18|nr:UDP-N-acetylmuramate dehydrogenase [Avrilella dinanensis]